VLEPQARIWLSLAGGLLAGRVFPRTPNGDDCTYCPFRVVCGDGVHARTARLLAGADGILADFAAVKGAPAAEEN
jgi:hypothetical protein